MRPIDAARLEPRTGFISYSSNGNIEFVSHVSVQNKFAVVAKPIPFLSVSAFALLFSTRMRKNQPWTLSVAFQARIFLKLSTASQEICTLIYLNIFIRIRQLLLRCEAKGIGSEWCARKGNKRDTCETTIGAFYKKS